MSPLYYFYKINMFFNIIILDSFTTFQTYNLISCDTSCNHNYVPLYCPRELNENEKKKNIKSRKMLVFKHTIIL